MLSLHLYSDNTCLFHFLDARGAIGVSQRASFIGRVRNMARTVAKAYIELRKEMGYPLLKEGDK